MKQKVWSISAMLVILLVAVSLLIAGCAKPTPAPTPTPPTPTPTPTPAPAPKEVFPSKTIVMICTQSPGGSFDAAGRMLCSVMGKELGVDVVLKNVPGAAHVTGTTVFYRSKPDGYTLAFLNMPGMILTQITRKVEYDVLKMEYVGREAAFPSVLSVGAKSPFKTIEDLQNAERPVKFPSSGGGTGHWVTVLGTKLLNIPRQSITATGGMAGNLAMLMRGDGDALFAGGPFVHARYAKSGDLTPILVSDDQRSPLLPDTPCLIEVTGDTPGARDLIYLATNRILIAPPGTPVERIKILEAALLKGMKSKDFMSWAKAVDEPVAPLNAAEAKKLIQGMVEACKKQVELL